MAALVIHPNTPGELREKLKKDLRRRHVTINEIRRTMDEGRVGVAYRKEVRGRHRRHLFDAPVGVLRSRVRGLERRIVQTKKAIKKRIEKDRKKVAKRAAKKAKQKR